MHCWFINVNFCDTHICNCLFLEYLEDINYKAITDEDTEPHEHYQYLNQFQQLWSGDYNTILHCFVRLVVGAYEWTNHLKDKNLDPEKLCTPSDEAFTLLVLENSYICWLDIFEQNNHQVPGKQHHEDDRKKKVVSNVKLAFTAGSIVYNKPPPKKMKGWSKEGIARFNELHNMIVEDWKNHPDCLQDFVRTEKQCLDQQECEQPTPATAVDIYEAVIEQFSDDEESLQDDADGRPGSNQGSTVDV